MMLAFIHANASYEWDHFRHFMAWAFNISNWMTNGSEQLIAIGIGAVISYMIWPKVHKAVDGWMKGHLHVHQDEMKKVLAAHHTAMKKHVAQEIAKLSPKEK